MPFYKSRAGQKIIVYAYDTANTTAKTGDAANITAYISLDGTTSTSATNDTNPTEIDATNAKGAYVFDLTLAESSADVLALIPVSGTADIQLDPVVIYTDKFIENVGAMAYGAIVSTGSAYIFFKADDDTTAAMTLTISGGNRTVS